jgi:hypothetical protein
MIVCRMADLSSDAAEPQQSNNQTVEFSLQLDSNPEFTQCTGRLCQGGLRLASQAAAAR